MRWSAELVVELTVLLCLVGAPCAARGQALADGDLGCESVTLSLPACQLVSEVHGTIPHVAGFGRLPTPGVPRLASRIFAVALPPGAQFVDMDYETGPAVVLPGRYEVPAVKLPRVIGDERSEVAAAERARYEATRAATYSLAVGFPAAPVEFVRTAQYRQFNLVDVRVTPFSYVPRTGELAYFPELTVNVHYRLPGRAVTPAAASVRVQQVAQDIVLNDASLTAWYPAVEAGRGLHDYVIITLDSLASEVAPLVSWETAKGRTVNVVTTTWINQTYAGYDLSEKIRNFLRDKYPAAQWGIEDVLLVGHYDDVPIRRTAQDVGYGMPETDFYFAELSQPDSASWDANGNRLWGEDSDPIDFYGEVNVGRIPWSDPNTVAHICAKSIAYEQNDDPAFKKNILLLGSFFWTDTDNAALMEAKVNQPWMSDWTMTRMYEQNSTVYSTYPCDYPLTHSNVMSVWSNGSYSFVNWAGHGSPTSAHIMGYGSAAFISNSDCAQLNDNYPAIIFADACSNGDTDHLNIGQAMLKQGGVGFVGATKVAFGTHGWDDPTDGSSETMDYFFTTNVTSASYSQGAAHQTALRDMYTYGYWYYTRYETFEWGVLLGNPNLGIEAALPLALSMPAGAPRYIDPGVAPTIEVQILDVSQSYVPGTAWLHYRYDDGDFLAVPLTDLGGDLHAATLPTAWCGDTLEFYVSADGDGGTTVYLPVGAPDTAYRADVMTVEVIAEEDFESDSGWTTASDGALSGFWQRGVPVDDLGWSYDPATDGDGSGQCWLTQNEIGNTDVDYGSVHLISPALDLSRGGIEISYDYYLRLTNTDFGIDMLLVELSDDPAGPWVEIERHTDDGGLEWRHHTITRDQVAAAGVTLTATMHLRFSANDDNPQSIVEAGVDGLYVASIACEAPWDAGDVNCDHVVDYGDINAFVLALTDPAGYAASYPGCERLNADLNGDGAVSFMDINPFVVLLTR